MIQLSDVGKHFGATKALGPVSFEIPAGRAVGFLGLNGVGKTTLLRILACDLRPSSGVARVAGSDVLEEPSAVRRIVGYLPESPPLYRDMTVADFLAFAGRIKGLDRIRVTERIREVVEITGLGPKRDHLIRHLSHGYRQRVGLAQAIVHDPEVLILDEPANGLDPVQLGEMRDMIRALRGSRTILISSHILPEISETCDEILILHDGEIVASGTEESLSARVSRTTEVTVRVRARSAAGSTVDASAVLSSLTGMPDVAAAELVERGADTLGFRVTGRGDVRAEVCRALVQQGCDVVHLAGAPRELERVFVELVRGAKA